MSQYTEALERLLRDGEALVRANRHAEGEACVRQVLAQQPRNTHGHYVLAVSALMQGRAADALDHVREALRSDRTNGRLHFLAGECHAAAGNLDDAVASYRRTVQYRPSDVLALNRLGYCERLLRNTRNSIAALERSIALDPGAAITHNELALALVQAGERARAAAALRRAVGLDAAFLEGWRNLAKLLYVEHVEAQQGGEREAGADAQLLESLERTLALDPDDTEMRFVRDSLNGTRAPRPPDGYVAGFFDRFAERFDGRLAQLQYRAPEVARELLSAQGRKPWRVADLGCGTGLSGEIVRPWASRLVGIDLSGEMLERARQRGVYDELVRAEIGDYLAAIDAGALDLVLALDVFIYVGALERVVAACAGALVPGGLLAFTVETLGEGDYVLAPSGRYAHSATYVDSVAAAAGLRPLQSREFPIRTDAGRPVPGAIHLFERVK